jgi:hypothetical protein
MLPVHPLGPPVKLPSITLRRQNLQSVDFFFALSSYRKGKRVPGWIKGRSARLSEGPRSLKETRLNVVLSTK